MDELFLLLAVTGVVMSTAGNLVTLYQGGKTDAVLERSLTKVADKLTALVERLDTVTVHQFDRLLDLLEKKLP